MLVLTRRCLPAIQGQVTLTAHAHDEFGKEDIKSFSAFATRHRPKITLEKPVTPERLVKAICDILEVAPSAKDVQKPVGQNSRQEIADLVKHADADTLKRIREMLK